MRDLTFPTFFSKKVDRGNVLLPRINNVSSSTGVSWLYYCCENCILLGVLQSTTIYFFKAFYFFLKIVFLYTTTYLSKLDYKFICTRILAYVLLYQSFQTSNLSVFDVYLILFYTIYALIVCPLNWYQLSPKFERHGENYSCFRTDASDKILIPRMKLLSNILVVLTTNTSLIDSLFTYSKWNMYLKLTFLA